MGFGGFSEDNFKKKEQLRDFKALLSAPSLRRYSAVRYSFQLSCSHIICDVIKEILEHFPSVKGAGACDQR